MKRPGTEVWDFVGSAVPIDQTCPTETFLLQFSGGTLEGFTKLGAASQSVDGARRWLADIGLEGSDQLGDPLLRNVVQFDKACPGNQAPDAMESFCQKQTSLVDTSV